MQNGEKVQNKPNISFGKPQIDENEINEVIAVLKSGWLTHGPKTKEFEKNFAEFCNAEYAVAVNSCTAALHLSLKALSVKKGDEVIVPAQTHVATAHAVMYQGATPVFADVEPNTYNLDPESVADKITKKTKGIMPVHFGGQPCKMKELADIADEHDLFIVEDAAHALGAEYAGKKIGSLDTKSACFSFYPIKHITTCEGGMLVTNDKDIAEKASLTRAFGITKSTMERTREIRPWYYEVTDIGYNYRMNEIGAAMGLCQLKKIHRFNDSRAHNFEYYRAQLNKINGIEHPEVIKGVKSANYFYQILITEKSRLSRNDLLQKLQEQGIGTSVHYPVPVHLMPVYRGFFGYKEGDLPNAERISKQALTLPVYPLLAKEHLEYIVKNIKDLLE